MSGVITDMIDCPQCGLPAIKRDYYVIGEEKVVCDYCGYSHLKTLEGSSEHKGFGTRKVLMIHEKRKSYILDSLLISFNVITSLWTYSTTGMLNSLVCSFGMMILNH